MLVVVWTSVWLWCLFALAVVNDMSCWVHPDSFAVTVTVDVLSHHTLFILTYILLIPDVSFNYKWLCWELKWFTAGVEAQVAFKDLRFTLDASCIKQSLVLGDYFWTVKVVLYSSMPILRSQNDQ
jgi:hypothetical protein